MRERRELFRKVYEQTLSCAQPAPAPPDEGVITLGDCDGLEATRELEPLVQHGQRSIAGGSAVDDLMREGVTHATDRIERDRGHRSEIDLPLSRHLRQLIERLVRVRDDET